jgi:hypothetical protein
MSNKMQASNGLFSYRTPEGLFEKVKRDWLTYKRDPTDDHLLNLLFPLSHLRDWIRPTRGNSDAKAAELYRILGNNEVYLLILALCNNAKHFTDKIGEPTNVLEGFRAGINHCGDNLGVRNHMVGGRPLREAAREVYRLYHQYFETLSEDAQQE